MRLIHLVIATFVQVLLTSFVIYTCGSPVSLEPNHKGNPKDKLAVRTPPTKIKHEAERGGKASRVEPEIVVKPEAVVAQQALAASSLEPVAPVESGARSGGQMERVPVIGASSEKHQTVEHLSPSSTKMETPVAVSPIVVVAEPVVAKPVAPVAASEPEALRLIPLEEMRKRVQQQRDSLVEGRKVPPSYLSEMDQHSIEMKPAIKPTQKTKEEKPLIDESTAHMMAKSGIEQQQPKEIIVKQEPQTKSLVEVQPAKEVVPNQLSARSAIQVAGVESSSSSAHSKSSLEEKKPVAQDVAKLAPEPVMAESVLDGKKSAPVQVAEPIAKAGSAPVVKGGQGPLHLLAATLCNYQQDRATPDDQINVLYSQRAALRKSLFEFMSLKFTNLEKLSSRLSPGLEAMPPKPASDSSSSNKVAPTHGWPVVGKCTAHDLRLMAEAAWCECADSASCEPVPKGRPSSSSSLGVASVAAPPSTVVGVNSQQATRNEKPSKRSRRSAELDLANLLPIDLGSSQSHSPVIVPKLFDSIVNGPAHSQPAATSQQQTFDRNSLSNLNLTQQQLSVIQAQAGLTQECKRNSLRFSKILFNHLAEDQSQESESWPKLYAMLQEDECARKRLVDIVIALSGYRTESSSIRRDNVEFAFAMDDLRSKVLETEVNTPLTFDRHFIEVEQFLQQSVKLMLANIDPERAKLTSMRYRSLMPAPMSVDDQCVQLHQLLLAKSHPQECNPNQYGQLPDILRMAASSLALWSIENDLSRLGAAKWPAPSSNNYECIANLVSS